MKSTNPVLKRMSGGGEPFGQPITIDEVVVRTATLFVVLLVTAVPAYVLGLGEALVFPALLASLVLFFFIARSRRVRPGLLLAYAALEGVVVGGISQAYAGEFGGNVVPQAILGTLAAFTAILVAYRTGLIRATAGFTKFMTVALLGYVIFGVVHLLGVMVGAWDSVYGGGGVLPLLVSAAGVLLATLTLVLDFNQVEKAIRAGVPAEQAWQAAFGLLLSLVWLYLEVLRFVGIAANSDD